MSQPPGPGPGRVWASKDIIGRGGFGQVYMGMTENGDLVAVKEVRVESSTTEDMREARAEYDLLIQLTHPNIVHVLDFSYDEKQRVARIVMEYVPGGCLARVISSLGRLPEKAIRNYTKEILQGLKYLHGKGIIHRDIKPHNILLRTEPGNDGAQVKLADFGFSKKIRDTASIAVKVKEKSEGADALVGTVPYMSPGSIQGEYTPQSDIWAIGCTVVEMGSGNMPWSELGIQDVVPFMFHIGSCEQPGQHPRVPDLSPSFKAFTSKCFEAERAQLSCDDLLSDPFLNEEVSEEAPIAAANFASIQEQVTTVLRQQDHTKKRIGAALHQDATPKWVFESNATSSMWSSNSSAVMSERGPVFREDQWLPWDKMWNRMSQLRRFTGQPFSTRYGHILPLIQYLMCCEGVDGVCSDRVSYHDDYLPFMQYFRDVESMVDDIAELNRRNMFYLGANTQSATEIMSSQTRGAMLIRPSRREKGKLVVTAKLMKDGRLDTKHFLIVRSQDTSQLTLFGAQSLLNDGDYTNTLATLIDTLQQRAPKDFSHGAGRREEPATAENTYMGNAYAM